MTLATAFDRRALCVAGAMTLVSGCGSATPEHAGQTSEPIINSVTSGRAEIEGMVQVSHNGWCSASVLQNDVVITARHCVTTDGTIGGPVDTNVDPSNYLLYMGSQTVGIIGLVAHDTLDVALLFRKNFFSVNGSHFNFSRAIYPGTDQSLVGQTLQCYGYGETATTNCSTMAGSGGGMGQPLEFANIAVGASTPSQLTYIAGGSSSPIQSFGDSGGSCLFAGQLTGINSRAVCLDPVTLKATPAPRQAVQVGPEAYRSWAMYWLNVRRHADTHYTSSSTVSGASTYINDPDLNGNPSAVLEVTHNWDPPGYGGVYDNANPLVWYDPSAAKWAIFNQNGTNMPTGAAFSYVVTPGGAQHFVATASNTSGFYMEPGLGQFDTSNAIIIVTQAFSGVLNDHPIGVLWDPSTNHWAVYNQDFQNIPSSAGFNVWWADPNQGAYVHTSTSSNTAYNYTYLDNMNLNGDPNAQIFVTPNLSPNGVTGVYNPHPIGVWYDTTKQQWSIYNEDGANMQTGVSFNVMLRP